MHSNYLKAIQVYKILHNMFSVYLTKHFHLLIFIRFTTKSLYQGDLVFIKSEENPYTVETKHRLSLFSKSTESELSSHNGWPDKKRKRVERGKITYLFINLLLENVN